MQVGTKEGDCLTDTVSLGEGAGHTIATMQASVRCFRQGRSDWLLSQNDPELQEADA